MLEINKVTNDLSKAKLDFDNDSINLTKREQVSANNKILFLRHVLAYLNTFPSEEFVKSEIGRLRNRLQLINDQFKEWVPTQYFETDKEKLKEYLKEMGVPKLKIQIKALTFIINE